jgi:acyl carrier protein
MEAERHFGVPLPDERAEKTVTIEQFARLLCELRAQTATPLPYEVVLLQLQQIVARQFKIPVERVVPEARFVEDMGLDR